MSQQMRHRIKTKTYQDGSKAYTLQERSKWWPFWLHAQLNQDNKPIYHKSLTPVLKLLHDIEHEERPYVVTYYDVDKSEYPISQWITISGNQETINDE